MKTEVQHDFDICAAFGRRDSVFSSHNMTFGFWVICRVPIWPSFPGIVLVLWGLKVFLLVICRIWFRMPNVPWCPDHKNTMFLTNVYENFDFPMVGENTYRVGLPSTSYWQEGIAVREEDEWIGIIRIRTEAVEGCVKRNQWVQLASEFGQ